MILPKSLGRLHARKGLIGAGRIAPRIKAPRASKALSSRIMFLEREPAALPKPLSSCTVEQEPTGRPMLVQAVTATDIEHLNET